MLWADSISTEWPSEIKPFYVMPKEGDENTHAFDLMYNNLELSQVLPVHQHDLLVKQIEERGLNPTDLKLS